MSGGTLGAVQRKLEAIADTGLAVPHACVALMAAIAHQLDYGYAGDSCLACARLRVLAAIDAFLDADAHGADGAEVILRDHSRNLCDRCAK